MNTDSENRPRHRRTGMGILAEILIAIAIFLGLPGLLLALDDSCSGVRGCEPLMDTQAMGRQMVVVAVVIGVPAVFMAYLSRGYLDDE